VKSNKTQLAMIAAMALIGMAQARAETITITSEFTPIENLSPRDRIETQHQFEAENPAKTFDWENLLLGKNEKGQTEVRDKNTLDLQAVREPTCSKVAQ
jgi:ABC-type glycerol-3-phosphate transport system substrate-binding protein